MEKTVVGIDLGGTFIKAGILDARGKIYAKRKDVYKRQVQLHDLFSSSFIFSNAYSAAPHRPASLPSAARRKMSFVYFSPP